MEKTNLAQWALIGELQIEAGIENLKGQGRQLGPFGLIISFDVTIIGKLEALNDSSRVLCGCLCVLLDNEALSAKYQRSKLVRTATSGKWKIVGTWLEAVRERRVQLLPEHEMQMK